MAQVDYFFSVLSSCACRDGVGFDRGPADRGLLHGVETYGADSRAAAQRGVRGMPGYLAGDGAPVRGRDRLAYPDRHRAGLA
ncbi:hypothetical protein [Roseovarius sp. M141]|uniref:hypothetical protein n=1 Tax=Roseovarius sp. M141 TaxID=2583806 RepID=UPI0020CE658C|nr:hypothetical protein [Roseovarius sp. M141]MCQ0093929.1 hypothetical protein [Roseovarius sp. M141]